MTLSGISPLFFSRIKLKVSSTIDPGPRTKFIFPFVGVLLPDTKFFVPYEKTLKIELSHCFKAFVQKGI